MFLVLLFLIAAQLARQFYDGYSVAAEGEKFCRLTTDGAAAQNYYFFAGRRLFRLRKNVPGVDTAFYAFYRRASGLGPNASMATSGPQLLI